MTTCSRHRGLTCSLASERYGFKLQPFGPQSQSDQVACDYASMLVNTEAGRRAELPRACERRACRACVRVRVRVRVRVCGCVRARVRVPCSCACDCVFAIMCGFQFVCLIPSP